MTQTQIEKGLEYWKCEMPNKNVVELAEYNGEKELIINCTQLDGFPHYDKYKSTREKKRVLTEWCEFLTENPYAFTCNGVQREHNKKLNNGLPILHKVPPKRDYGRYFCIMAEKGGTSHGGLTEKLSPFFHAKQQEVNAYGR